MSALKTFNGLKKFCWYFPMELLFSAEAPFSDVDKYQMYFCAATRRKWEMTAEVDLFHFCENRNHRMLASKQMEAYFH